MSQEQQQQNQQEEGEFKRNPKIHKTDNPVIGLLSGFLFMFLGVIVIYFFRHNHFSFERYLKIFTTLDNPMMLSEASKILSLSLVALLIPFYYFLNRKRYYATRGIIISAMIVGVLVIMYKFIW